MCKFFWCCVCSTFFLMGPWNQLKRMFAETRIIATIIVLVCIVMAFLTFCSLLLNVIYYSLVILDPRVGHTIYLCRLSFWLTLPRGVLSTYWCCPSRPCMVFLACVHLALFLALSLSPGNSLVSSWCDHSMLASLLWQCLTVLSLLQLC